MTTIHQFLKIKGHHFHSVGPGETVYAAIKFMAEKDIGSLLVMDGGMLKGILTERNYAREVVLKGRTSPQTLVQEIMQLEVSCIEPSASVEAALEVMTVERVRHLPVVDGGRVVGIISIGDLVKSLIDAQRFAIDQLEGYIHGEVRIH